MGLVLDLLFFRDGARLQGEVFMARICLLVIALTFVLLRPAAAQNQFRRGDADGNGLIQLSDAVRVQSVVLGILPVSMLSCRRAADANDDNCINLNDVVLILDFLFMGGPPPPPPGPFICGPDPTPVPPLPMCVPNGGILTLVGPPSCVTNDGC